MQIQNFIRFGCTAALTLVSVGTLLSRQETLPKSTALRPIPILLDTDIGSDIDDAFAVALILRSPELELIGVTTVSGDTKARQRLAAKLLWESGQRDIPVAAGAPGKALPIEQSRWADAFASPAMQSTPAVEFLKQQIEAHPGVTVIALGPLTNLSALIRQYPATAKKIKLISLMGGSVARGYGRSLAPAAEYNIAQDVPAAQTVFESGIPLLVSPLDTTSQLTLDERSRHRVFTQLNPTTNALALLYFLWGQSSPILYDPMAVAMLIQPDLCETQKLALRVDAKGFTQIRHDAAPNATVGMHSNPRRFIDFYLGRVAPVARHTAIDVRPERPRTVAPGIDAPARLGSAAGSGI
jgi:inosine-uridine nucleoside N-ribohydrolase